MGKTVLEICCGSAEDALEAFRGGADRAELCGDLFHGGLTPSLGSVKTVRAGSEKPFVAMIRPREGGFCYTETEFEVALRDAEAILEAGADGLVFGFLLEDGRIDPERTERLVSLTKRAGKQSVFHRAFDVTPDWKEAMDLLIALGVTRVLTSGQEKNVLLGLERVRDMREYAAGRIEVMPGAGIRLHNVEQVIRETGCSAVHMSARMSMPDASAKNDRGISFSGSECPPEDVFYLTDRELVARIAAKLVAGSW